MADRIFPSAEQDSLGSTKQINTIDWEKFAASINKRVAATKPSVEEIQKHIGDESDDQKVADKINEELELEGDDKVSAADVADARPEETQEPTEGMRTSAWKDLKKWLDKNKKKGPKSKDDEEDKDEEEEEEDHDEDEEDHDHEEDEKKDKKKKSDDGMMKRKGLEKSCSKCGGKYAGEKCSCSSKTASKIVFTHPDQISAEALMQAKTAGNENLVRAILAAREDRNRVIESRLERLAQEESDKNQRLAQRREQRAAIVAQAEDNAKRLASADASVAKNVEGFKTVAALKNNEKEVIAQRLLENGFPAEYVEATLGLYQQDAPMSSEENQIREVMSSSLNESTKRTAVASLVKVAELSQEQLDRCIRFWVDELGYGDEQWVRDLFAKK
ncbi:MAG: hypothetical protein RLZ10_55 [Bacteroidota bacterium]|jgi:hypothetical protein